MKKLAIIDLAGPIADESQRFELARTPVGSMNWQVFFDPTHVSLDTLVEEADAAIATLQAHGYTVLLMTSRPEAMREATQTWCQAHQITLPLAMKPPAAQFLKTVQLKAVMVQMLAGMEDAHEVLVVEDEVPNLTAILHDVTAYHLRGFLSLAACIAALDHPTGEIDAYDEDDMASPF